ncbi:MAG: GNAT family N-acetyltransferase [Desulfobacteraceae bacterium]|nr:MAG: GNAT family N-acetyltransferase [Desulfobacteraceae bacterium]
MDSLNIREITLDDAEDIQQIRKRISEDDAHVEFEKILKRHVDDGTTQSCLVAELDSKVVGYMISTQLYAGFGVKKSAWIMAIGVDPDHMGQGIGLKMAEEICEIYKKKGIEYIYSSVLWDSIDVLSFFKKLGFERSQFINLRKKL